MKTKQPENVYEPRTTYLSERSIIVLAEHALGLPVRSPARQIITLMVERWWRGAPIAFDPTSPHATINRCEVLELLKEMQSSAQVVDELAARFKIRDSELTDAEIRALMEQAA